MPTQIPSITTTFLVIPPPPPFQPTRLESEFYGREKSFDDVWKYIESAMKLTSHAFNAEDKKFALLGTWGMKGIGKS